MLIHFHSYPHHRCYRCYTFTSLLVYTHNLYMYKVKVKVVLIISRDDLVTPRAVLRAMHMSRYDLSPSRNCDTIAKSHRK